MDVVALQAELRALPPEQQDRISAFLAVATAHQPAIAADWTTLRDRWLAIYQTAAGGRGKLGDAAGQRRDTREALATQLTRNLLTLALHFLGQPDKAAELFDESRLQNPSRNTGEPVPAG